MRDIRKPAAALVLIVLFAAVGCGGPSDTEKVRNLVNGYITDFVNHDGKAMCGKLTAAAQQRIQKAAGILRGRDCAATLTTVSRLPTGSQAEAIRHYHTGKVVIDGKEAGAVIVPSPPGSKPTRIVKVGDSWLIDGSVSIAG